MNYYQNKYVTKIYKIIKPLTRGKARSSISMHTPSRTPIAGGMSKRCKMTGCLVPKTSPLAIMEIKEYAIWPAAPVTTTRIGSLSA